MAVAPADDPEIALLVILDTPGESIPQNQRSGGYIAAPLAGDILEDVLPYLGYEPEYTGAELFGAQTAVPNVAGLSTEEAKSALAAKGFKEIVFADEGATVTGQIPAAGAKVVTSSKIILYTQGDAPADTVTVPSVVGLSPETANARLTNAGLYLRPTGSLSSSTSTIAAASQSVEAGAEVPRGTIVEVSFLDSNVGDYAASGVTTAVG